MQEREGKQELGCLSFCLFEANRTNTLAGSNTGTLLQINNDTADGKKEKKLRLRGKRQENRKKREI